MSSLHSLPATVQATLTIVLLAALSPAVFCSVVSTSPLTSHSQENSTYVSTSAPFSTTPVANEPQETFAETTATFTIQATTPQPKNCSCNGHGDCNSLTGECSCFPGFTGANCSTCAPGFSGPACEFLHSTTTAIQHDSTVPPSTSSIRATSGAVTSLTSTPALSSAVEDNTQHTAEQTITSTPSATHVDESTTQQTTAEATSDAMLTSSHYLPGTTSHSETQTTNQPPTGADDATTDIGSAVESTSSSTPRAEDSTTAPDSATTSTTRRVEATSAPDSAARSTTESGLATTTTTTTTPTPDSSTSSSSAANTDAPSSRAPTTEITKTEASTTSTPIVEDSTSITSNDASFSSSTSTDGAATATTASSDRSTSSIGTTAPDGTSKFVASSTLDASSTPTHPGDASETSTPSPATAGPTDATMAPTGVSTTSETPPLQPPAITVTQGTRRREASSGVLGPFLVFVELEIKASDRLGVVYSTDGSDPSCTGGDLEQTVSFWTSARGATILKAVACSASAERSPVAMEEFTIDDGPGAVSIEFTMDGIAASALTPQVILNLQKAVADKYGLHPGQVSVTTRPRTLRRADSLVDVVVELELVSEQEIRASQARAVTETRGSLSELIAASDPALADAEVHEEPKVQVYTAAASTGLSSGAIVGIVVGCLFALGLVALGVVLGRRRAPRAQAPPAELKEGLTGAPIVISDLPPQNQMAAHTPQRPPQLMGQFVLSGYNFGQEPRQSAADSGPLELEEMVHALNIMGSRQCSEQGSCPSTPARSDDGAGTLAPAGAGPALQPSLPPLFSSSLVFATPGAHAVDSVGRRLSPPTAAPDAEAEAQSGESSLFCRSTSSPAAAPSPRPSSGCACSRTVELSTLEARRVPSPARTSGRRTMSPVSQAMRFV